MAKHNDDIEQAEVRTVWPHEALDFTPWLAKNLDLLGKEIGLKLKLTEVEAPVGPFSCDIHAKELCSGVSVAIENQLEWTDHSHLTQLLTYTAGLDARIGIWVAPEFRYEHAETLHWLNQWTREGVNFFGVKIEAVKIGDSRPKARFLKVVYPGGWNKDIAQPAGATMSPDSLKYSQFFQPLIDHLRQTGFSESAIQHFDRTGRFFRSRLNRGIGYAASLEGKNDAWVSLHVSMEEGRERTKQIFDALYADRVDIESKFAPGKEWRWNRHDSHFFSSINVRRDGSIHDSHEELDEIRGWMEANLREFQKVFDCRLAKILTEFPTSG